MADALLAALKANGKQVIGSSDGDPVSSAFDEFADLAGIPSEKRKAALEAFRALHGELTDEEKR